MMIDFSLLYDKHIDNLFAFGSKFTTNREVIKDCIHDVFVKLLTKREMLNNVENIDRYLYVALKNRLHDEFRRNEHMCDKEIDDTCMHDIAEQETYNHELREREQAQFFRVENLFNKLPPRQQQIIHLYYVEQHKYYDICQIMGINYQSVRNLMHRSILRLRILAEKSVPFI